MSPLHEKYVGHCLQPFFTLICADSIHYKFKQVLHRQLGIDWYQLAQGMGIPRTDIDTIRETPGSLPSKIDMFLTKFRFPSFKSDRETAEFILEALAKASLPAIAAEVQRDLEHELDIKGA